MKRKVVIITDCIDVALLEIRGAIYSSSNNDDYQIEPIVQVKEMNIVNTSFLIRLIAGIYPNGTIINVIVNPLQLRTERIVGRLALKDIVFEGTNTGAFGWVIEDFGCSELIELYDPGFVPFGGKYVHAPAVGKILSGCELKELGHAFSIDRIRDVGRKEGVIVHIDNFGNVKFIGDLSKHQFGDVITVSIREKKYEVVYWERMMERMDGEIVIYPGSSFGLPEIGVVRGSAEELFKVIPGDIIEYN